MAGRRSCADERQLRLVERPLFALGMIRVRIANAMALATAGGEGWAKELAQAEMQLVEAQEFIANWSQYQYRRNR